MNDQEILDIYMLQSQNVRYLKKVIGVIQKDINFYLRKSDDFQVKSKSKIFSLVYSAWSEAQFIQIMYTPNGFLYSEILKIKEHKERNGIASGWKYMISIAIDKVADIKINADIKNRLKTLLDLVSLYIEDPSILRNKIAHGQWLNALNRENTAKNNVLSIQLDQLDPIQLGKRVEVHQYLGYIVRDLVQSPKAGFHNYYWTNIVNLEEFIKKTANWSLESRKKALAKKPIHIKNTG